MSLEAKAPGKNGAQKAFYAVTCLSQDHEMFGAQTRIKNNGLNQGKDCIVPLDTICKKHRMRSIVYCLLARSCLGVRAARCVVAPGVPLERRESRDGKSLDLTRMHGSGKLMRVLQAGCRGRSRRRPTRAPWC